MARKRSTSAKESDSTYFLKILLYFVLGLVWIKVNGLPIIPAGAIVGAMFAQHDHFAIDRKLEYLILLVSAAVGLAGAGFFVAI
jgi:hypothetical protein